MFVFQNKRILQISNLFLLPDFIGVVMVYLTVMSRPEWKAFSNRKVQIVYGFGGCPFGKCLLALLGDKVCHLSFVTHSEDESLNLLKRDWPEVKTFSNRWKSGEISALLEQIFQGNSDGIEAIVKCTRFEAKVWKALLSVPPGKLITYSELAKMAGEDHKARAVGAAVAKNSIAFLIPCHRVIRKDGRIHRYKWGSQIKQNIINFETKAFLEN